MEAVPFLRDIDDEKHYAQLLEVAYCEAYSEVDKILRASTLSYEYKPGFGSQDCMLTVPYEDLACLRAVMNCTVLESVERRRRLADITAGLADVVLDEEGTKE